MEQLKLNMIPNGVNPVFHASQYDKGRQIRFVLDETLSSAEVTVSYRAKDGTEYGNVQTSVSGNTITDTIPEEVLTDYGIIEGEVDIDGIGSLNFFVEVEKDAYDGGVITTQTATGPIATFETNIETAFVSLKSDINPVQDLHGYSKPWSGGGGKNKLNNPDKTTTQASYVINNVNVPMVAGNYILSFDFSGTSNSSSLRIDDENGTAIFTTSKAITSGHNEFLINLPSNASFVKLFSNAVGTYTKFQLEQGSTATAYEPYSNICPISGFSALNVTRTGKNLLQKSFDYFSSVPDNISSCFYIKKGTYTFSFASSTATYWRIGIKCKDLSGNDLSDNAYRPEQYFTWNTPNKMWLQGSNNTNKSVTVNFVDDCYIRFVFALGDTSASTTFADVILNVGSSVSTYEPYNGQTATVNFGQIVYGGVADVTNGKVTINGNGFKLVDNNNIALQGSSNNNNVWRILSATSNVLNNNKQLCTIATYDSNAWSPNDSRANTFVIGGEGNLYLQLPKSVANTLADFITYITNNDIFFYHEKASPIEITTTPENLTAISGENNVYSDTNGDTTVEYYIEV